MNSLPKCFKMSRKFFGILKLAERGLLVPISTSITNAPHWVTISFLCALALVSTAIELSDLNDQ